MSFDEARFGFTNDAPATTATKFYLFVGDDAYGYSWAGTNLNTGSLDDLDTYKITVSTGYSYSITKFSLLQVKELPDG